MGYWHTPTGIDLALVIGGNGTVIQAEKYYHVPSPGPRAHGCPAPRSQPTHRGVSRSVVFWDSTGPHVLELGAGPWAAWVADGEAVFDLVAVKEVRG